MEEKELDTIVFEMDDGTELSFGILHEFNYAGGRYAVLRPEGGAPGEALIAEIVDPMGPDEEYVPLPLARQQTLLEHLNREGFETD